MSIRRLAAPAAAALALLAPLAVVAPTAQAVTPPTTAFRTLQPWNANGTLAVRATIRTAPAGSMCTGSNLTGRKDAYRCYVGNYVMDPMVKSPRANTFAMLGGDGVWRAYRVGTVHTERPGKAQIVRLRLANGAVCAASSGAGPAALPRFPYWVGTCFGGPYRDGVTWRATVDDHRNPNYPLLALNASRTRWAAAVETSPGTVTFQPVATAWR